MAELGYTQVEIAKKLDISQTALSQKLNGFRKFTLVEVKKMCDILKIDNCDISNYFF